MTEQTARVLVVANRTAESDELIDAVYRRSKRPPAAKFTLLVPATPHGVAWAADMHAGSSAAEEHVRRALDRLEAAGVEVEGKVGDPDPLAAVQDEANFASYDEVIVSTLPTHLSRWLRMDLPRRVAHATGLPVTHVVAHERARAAT